ncbi:dolichyl-diphosphooligosaccharide--protein glycosyltransferase subunit 1, partial [Caerostris extrusa]
MYYSIFLLLFFSFSYGHGQIINSKVERNIDIASQLVKITVKVTLENTGSLPVTTFDYALEPEMKMHLSYFGASQVQEENKLNLKVEEIKANTNKAHRDMETHKIYFENPLKSGKSTTLRLEIILSHYLIPYPSSITQSDKQLVLYHGNHYYYSPYLTKTQTTVVTLPSNSVESYSKLKPVSHSENLITYGP